MIPFLPRAIGAGRQFVSRLSADGRAGLSSLGWSYSTHVGQLVIRVVSSKILMHLLMPENLAVANVALTAQLVLDHFSDIGLRPAVGRSPRGEDPKFLGTAWAVFIVRACLLSVACFALAWVLPAFYEGKMPGLGTVLLVVCLRPLWTSLINPTVYVLFRRLDYRTPFFLDMTQTLIATGATIWLAWRLQNYWALVFGLIIGDGVRLVLSHVLCPRAPRLHWDRAAVRELAAFGRPIFVNTLIWGAWFQFDRFVGPRLVSERDMGLFFFAWSAFEALDGLIGRGSEVFYSMLGRKPDGEERAAFYRRILHRLTSFVLPGLALLAVALPFPFGLYYNAPDYHGAIVLFGLLATRLIMRTTSQVQFMYLMVRGDTAIATGAYVVSLVVLAATFFVWVQVLGLGVLGIAVSSVLSMTTYTLAQTVLMIRRREATPWPFLAALGWTVAAIAGVLFLYMD